MANEKLMVPDITRDALASSLRVGYEAIIKEADEWRPLAQHVLDLMSAKEKENQKLKLLVRKILNCASLMVKADYMIVVIPRDTWMAMLDVEYGDE